MNLNFLLSVSVLMGLNCASFMLDLYKETANPTNTNFPKIHNNKTILLSQQPNIVSTRGFDFQFIECEPISTDELVCSFVVVNNQPTRSLSLWTQQSKIIDGEGNVISGSLAQLGKMDAFRGFPVDGEDLPPKIPIKGKVLFRNIPAGATIKVRYIEFNFNQFKIGFSTGS